MTDTYNNPEIFEERVDQGFDDKQFTGSLSTKSLAIGKVPIKFTEVPENTILSDLSEFHDVQAESITSVTNELLSKGTDPLLLEPVNLRLKVPEGQQYKVTVLDHDGMPTGKVISGSGDHFEISGADHKAIYYLMERLK